METPKDLPKTDQGHPEPKENKQMEIETVIPSTEEKVPETNVEADNNKEKEE